MENKKAKKNDREAALWLLKPLQLEKRQGFQNNAVAGGLEKWLGRLEEKLVAQAGLSKADARHLVSQLADYAAAPVQERERKIARVFAFFQGSEAPKAVAAKPAPKPSVPEQIQPAGELLRDFETPVQYLKGVGPQRARLLKNLGVNTVMDLLRHYPRDWQDRRHLARIQSVKHGEPTLICGEVRAKQTFRVRRGLAITKVILDDGTGQIAATWFNQPYMQDRFEVGQQVFAYGKVEFFRGFQIMNPDFEILEDESEAVIHSGRIVPIYNLTERLSQRVLRSIQYALQTQLPESLPEILPEKIVREQAFPRPKAALQNIHFPPDFEALDAARRRLIFEELFLQQLAVVRMKNRYQQQQTEPLTTTGKCLETFRRSLPFALTGAQNQALAQILADLALARPMHRLLQGDVGSGKTIVAALAMLAAVDSGKQAALMAPTEVLATQHTIHLKKLLEPLGVRVEQFTSGLKAAERRESAAALEAGEIDIAVGTHALTQESITFKNLGLAVVDEQHRFGVEQRARLRAKGIEPHVLVMTATPIPRTLAMTVYGDLDVTTIDELPPGRMPVVTDWLASGSSRKAYDQVRAELKLGRQAYIIFPLIDESEKLDLKALTTEYTRLTQHVFQGFSIGLLHGRLSIQEKEEVMADFKSNRVQILAATTVVEVGLDIPNATVMVIEHADRFGLAALHQLRGRVGRGSHASFCYLIADPTTEEGRARMKIMCKVKDGFQLAEEDLALRGPGEFFGLRQHGLPDLKLANLIRDAGQIDAARQAAAEIISEDPNLGQSQYQSLKQVFFQIYGDKEERVLAG